METNEGTTRLTDLEALYTDLLTVESAEDVADYPSIEIRGSVRLQRRRIVFNRDLDAERARQPKSLESLLVH